VSSAVYPTAIRGLSYKVVKTPEFSNVIQAAPDPLMETRIAQAVNPRWHWQLMYDFLANDLSNTNLTYSELATLMGFLLARQASYDSFLFDDPEDDAVTNQPLQLVTDTTNPVSAATVGSGGSGFNVGDQLAVTGGGGTGAVLSVASVSSGAITGFNIVAGGAGYATTSGAALAVLTGSGSGSPTANITAVSVYYTPVQRNMGGQFFEDLTDLNLQGQAEAFPNLTGAPNKIFANGVQQSQSYSGNTGNFDLLGPGLAFPGFSSAGLYLKWHSAPATPITGTFKFYFRARFEMSSQDFSKFLYLLWTIGGEEEHRGSGLVKLVSTRQ
jgi:hypothetical protein